MVESNKDIRLSELKDMVSKLNTTIKTLNDTIARQQAENDDFKAEPAWFCQKLFGSSSERRTDEQKHCTLCGTEMIPGSYVSESLLAHIIYQKYGLYLPLYRQEQDFLQLNAPISRVSMAHWIITVGQEYIQPMYDYFRRELLKRRFLMMDWIPSSSIITLL